MRATVRSLSEAQEKTSEQMAALGRGVEENAAVIQTVAAQQTQTGGKLDELTAGVKAIMAALGTSVEAAS